MVKVGTRARTRCDMLVCAAQDIIQVDCYDALGSDMNGLVGRWHGLDDG